ncbi:MAG: amidohydrolase [Bacteroidota bacterium]
MKWKLTVGAVLGLGLAAIGLILFSGPREVTMVLLNGRVYTVDGNWSVQEAIAIDGDRVVEVGSSKEIGSSYAGETVIDLKGRPVFPGFIDSHAHLESLGSVLATLNLAGSGSLEEVSRLVRGAAARKEPGQWIRGRGWDQNLWREKRFPHHRDLDGAAPENPVYLVRIDGHAVWVNRPALELTGISSNTPDPPGGKILRDRDGEPTGVFIDRAIDLVSASVPGPTPDERMVLVEKAVAECIRYGLTQVHDMGVDSIGILLYKKLVSEGRLPLRVYAALEGHDGAWGWYREHGPEVNTAGNMLTIRAVKLYADGALGSRGAAMLTSYSDDPTTRGLALTSEADLRRAADQCLESGFQLCVHAIGDRGNALTLNVYESAFKSLKTNTKDVRFRVEHAQILHPEEIPKFARLGVIPSMQPTHCTSDMYWAEERVGQKRAIGAYAWRSLIDAGSIIPAGSDFPVEGPNPLWGFYAAITRQDQSGWPEGGWYGEQRMTREEALKAFTIWGAYAAFQEDEKGSLEPGKWADLVVLSGDLMSIPAEEIPAVRVDLTVVGGRVVFSSEE